MGTKYCLTGLTWPDKELMRDLLLEYQRSPCFFLSAEEVQEPIRVMRLFCDKISLEASRALMREWFQAVEAYRGPYRERMARAPSEVYEMVLVIIEAVFGLVERGRS